MEKRDHPRRQNTPKRTRPSAVIDKLFANLGGNPDDLDNQDWYFGESDLRLTKVFSVVLALHIVAVGGILAFKMLNKASLDSAGGIAAATTVPAHSITQEKELAGRSNNPMFPTTREAGEPGRYVVAPGDTLSGIATRLGVSTAELCRVNNINEPDDVAAGMLLRVPVGSGETENYDQLPSHPISTEGATDDIKESGTSKSRSSGVIYQVQRGDTAWGIAQKFGITHQSLLQYNNIDRPENLQVGKVIEIPSR